MKNYSLGFMFSEDLTKVALIKKEKPEWQKGHLNGIGGQIEEGENPLVCMIREFEEETGVFYELWDKLCVLSNEHFTLHCYSTYSNQVFNLTTTTREQVTVIEVNQLSKHKHIANLDWMIPLAIQQYTEIDYKIEVLQ